MKTRILYLAALLAMVVVLVGVVHSQMAIKTPLFRVDVPFNFMAANMHMPAGEYLVSHVDPYLVMMETKDGSARSLIYVHPADVDYYLSNNKLVFNKYGDRYFLAQVWTELHSEVHHTIKYSAEQALAAKLDKPQTRIVMAKR